MDSYAQAVLEKFEGWLRMERGLAAASVQTYVRHSGVFMEWLTGPAESSVVDLDARQVVRFVAWNADRGYSQNYLITRHNALRCFLRFLQRQGLTGRSMAAQVDALLSCFDPSTAVGLRDKAMVLLMARLGLRRVEVARLRLEDVDWRFRTLTLPRSLHHRAQALQADQLRRRRGYRPFQSQGRDRPGRCASSAAYACHQPSGVRVGVGRYRAGAQTRQCVGYGHLRQGGLWPARRVGPAMARKPSGTASSPA